MPPVPDTTVKIIGCQMCCLLASCDVPRSIQERVCGALALCASVDYSIRQEHFGSRQLNSIKAIRAAAKNKRQY